MKLLESVALAGNPISATQLQQITQLPLPTCYRALQALTEQEFLEDPGNNKRYVISRRVKRIAAIATTDTDASEKSAPLLLDATNRLGDTVFLSRFKNAGVSIIHVETPSDPAIAHIHPGLGYRPLHACSCSKAIAAFSDSSFQTSVLNGQMKAYTAQTHTDRSMLEREFEAIRKKGYAECVEELEVGVTSVAAPVQIAGHGALFSVGAIGPVRRLKPNYRKKLGNQLIELANEIEQMLRLSAVT